MKELHLPDEITIYPRNITEGLIKYYEGQVGISQCCPIYNRLSEMGYPVKHVASGDVVLEGDWSGNSAGIRQEWLHKEAREFIWLHDIGVKGAGWNRGPDPREPEEAYASQFREKFPMPATFKLIDRERF